MVTVDSAARMLLLETGQGPKPLRCFQARLLPGLQAHTVPVHMAVDAGVAAAVVVAEGAALVAVAVAAAVVETECPVVGVLAGGVLLRLDLSEEAVGVMAAAAVVADDAVAVAAADVAVVAYDAAVAAEVVVVMVADHAET